jgi:quercetin dioxygenase-like cupin family protein
MHIKENLIKTQGFDKLQIQKVVRNDQFEILSITLEAGALFPEHTSPSEAVLVLLEGQIDFHISGAHYDLQPQESIQFDAHTEHWVMAKENSKFLIIR